ncbi:MAG: hypothetical protein HN348_10795 [Proteobacteria bacterium]|nr:hypothetical protein [Pseudomonadota bacterium]
MKRTMLSLAIMTTLLATGGACVVITPYESDYKDKQASGDTDSDTDSCVATPEICDGQDNDCDGETDEDVDELLMPLWFVDLDVDGWGAIQGDSIRACENLGDYVQQIGDCDDTNADRFPNNVEKCDDIDNNCDGNVDEDLPLISIYVDADGDGIGDDATMWTTCDSGVVPTGFVDVGGDCNDLEDSIYPGATELCNDIDDDCDSDTDEDFTIQEMYLDGDGDGFGDPSVVAQLCELFPGYVDNDSDCDDDNGLVYPGAEEVCDDKNNDCQGGIDDDESYWTTYFVDDDNDGFANMSEIAFAGCGLPPDVELQILPTEHDCDDDDQFIHPGVEETCNGIDENCDGEIDNNLFEYQYYADNDGDSQGDPAKLLTTCFTPPPGYAANQEDCNDNDASIYDGAPEICDGKINDCDGQGPADDGLTATFWVDVDGDGFGDQNGSAIVGCLADYPTYATNDYDCDDDEATINVGLLYWPDLDEDGFGDELASPTFRCNDGAAKWVQNNLDCHDGDDTFNPLADEVCDGEDRDCDGNPQNGFVMYIDFDGDGLGGDDTAVTCSADGFSLLNGDCDDLNEEVNPYRAEVCGNGYDDNCDGLGCLVGEGVVTEMDGSYEVTGDTDAPALGTAFAVGKFTDQADMEIVVGAPELAETWEDGFLYLVNAAQTPSGNIGSMSQRFTTFGDGEGQWSTAMGFSLAVADHNQGQGDDDDDDDDGGDKKANDKKAPDTEIFQDLVIGAPHERTNETGVMWISTARPGEESIWEESNYRLNAWSDSVNVVRGSAEGDKFGYSVAAGVDVTFDGEPDILAGAPYCSMLHSWAGAVLLLTAAEGTNTYGATQVADLGHGLYLGGDASDLLGWDVAFLDFDGDSAHDVALGAPGDGGRGRIYLVGNADLQQTGVKVLTTELSPIEIEGENNNSQFGAVVHSGEDAFGDGYEAVIVGAPRGKRGTGMNIGAVYLLAAHQTQNSFTVGAQTVDEVIFEGEIDDSYTGQALTMGDFNYDSHVDVAIGAPEESLVYIVYGPFVGGQVVDLGADADARIEGENVTDAFGAALLAHDLNGDLYDDLLIGAPGSNNQNGGFYVMLAGL